MVPFTEGGSHASMPNGSHDEFLELCALSASGELSPTERKKLSQHLAACDSCREAQQQFESLVDGPIRRWAAEAAEEYVHFAQQDSSSSRSSSSSSSWSLASAEADLFRRLAAKGNVAPVGSSEVPREKLPDPPRRVAVDGAWRELWISYAAVILLVLSLAIAAYRGGMRPSVNRNKPPVASTAKSPNESRLQQQISDLSYERELAQTGMGQRDRLIGELKRQLTQQSAELAELKGAQSELLQEASVRKSGQDSVQEKAELGQKLQQAEVETQALRRQLEAIEQESAQDNSRVAILQAKVDDLARTLEEKNSEVVQDKELLAHDRDIRELMGARDLYISEVYDVARSGEMQKAFGRVFYTKEKSLIFYAYDLDQEAGINNASFQAWGQRGPDRSQALNLGIFYEDNKQKKRWVLKFNDAKDLRQIEAVFVTIEPEGGSRRPSGKPLLFAYLKMDPNHP
jgi:hypothetical protein